MVSPPDTNALPGQTHTVYTVSALNREARLLLETGFPLIWVEGEISNFSRPASGHMYFSLKDAGAQVHCAFFRNRNLRLPFAPANGRQVLVRARVSLYETRGEFQLIVEHMEEAGHGALQRAFEALKQRLAAEGLFAAAHKRPLPRLPRTVGVLTSPTGAAIRDILSVLQRRFPAVRIVIYPVPVQGEGAGSRIADMMRKASARAECDVLIVARGGGSLEDLWAFNEETVARAIYDASMPVVSGVGHEVDFTIADFVADHRAPTPTAAAELVTPDAAEWLRNLERLALRLDQAVRSVTSAGRERLMWCERRLQQLHPGRQLRDRSQRVDELEQRLGYLMRTLIERKRGLLAELGGELRRESPGFRIERLADRLATFGQRLRAATAARLEASRSRITVAMRALDAVSPLATLNRGYAIVTDATSGRVLTDSRSTAKGHLIRARLARGSLLARIEGKEPNGGKS